MPQTADTFTSQTLVSGPTNMPGGVSMTVVAFSFGGTAASFNVVSPYSNVTAAIPRGAPTQIISGTTLDTIVLNNSLGANGNVTLIAASTNGLDIATPTILQVSRSGTNNQDATLVIFSKGG